MNYRKLLINLGIVSLMSLPVVLGSGEKAKAQRRVLTIHNHTEANLTELYVSPEWSRYWGQNQLDGILKPGDSATVIITGNTCEYDILARDGNYQEVPPGGFGEFNVCDNDHFALTDSTMRVVQWP
ncbi:hypothetical protein [Cyanothece sp. BG0011]|uniref:hypothetical protein n=1 Tax=Cyanothece sp. BG0011 TaxID=2082950 RepID=UPI000D1DD7ED|nr:hypothetical protein [Cyanothece sp. BG0011]